MEHLCSSKVRFCFFFKKFLLEGKIFMQSQELKVFLYSFVATGGLKIFLRHKDISIWPSMKKYIQACKNGKTSEPLCKSYKLVNYFICDKLIIAKLHCFSYLANVLQPLLQKHQTSDPVAVFLSNDLFTFIKRLYFFYSKDEAVQALSLDGSLHPSKQDKSSFKGHMFISIGSAAEQEVKVWEGKAVSDLDNLNLKMSFQNFVICIISKIVDKSPIRYSFAREITCLNPENFGKEDSQKKFANVVSYLRTRRSLSYEEVVSSKFEYFVFRKSHEEIEVDGKRLDESLRSLKELNTMQSLKKVINICLCLSHGNAEIERGFSVKKEVSVDNLNEECLIAKRNLPIQRELGTCKHHFEQRSIDCMQWSISKV